MQQGGQYQRLRFYASYTTSGTYSLEFNEDATDLMDTPSTPTVFEMPTDFLFAYWWNYGMVVSSTTRGFSCYVERID